MAKAFFSNNFPLPGPPPPSKPSRPPAGRRNIVTAAASGFASVSAAKHAVDRAAVLVRSTPASGVDAGETIEAGGTPAEEKVADASQNPKGGFNLAMLPNVPDWAKWFVGPLLLVALPFYKKFMSIEDEVEKTVETVVEVAEEVAKVTKNVVTDVAEALPEGELKKLAVEVEEIAQVAIDDSEKVKTFICQVDEVKEEVEHFVDPILKGKSS